jgi:serine/threonine protein kinase
MEDRNHCAQTRQVETASANSGREWVSRKLVSERESQRVRAKDSKPAKKGRRNVTATCRTKCVKSISATGGAYRIRASMPITPGTDIYNFGVVIYEALTGQYPFPGELTPATLRERQLSGSFPDPHEVRPDLPADLDDLAAALGFGQGGNEIVEHILCSNGLGFAFCRKIRNRV